MDHTRPGIARRIHAVQMSAYAQEARLLGVTSFPPLGKTVEDVRSGPGAFLAALAGDEIVGAVRVEPDDEGLGTNISSLVVAPPRQRQGIGRALLAAVLAGHGDRGVTVQTAAANVPALALYRGAGFVEHRRWTSGREALEIVKLRRDPLATADIPD